MKMLRYSSSPYKNAVLMSPHTSFPLFVATHCKIKASACAETGRKDGSSVRVLVPSVTQT